MDDPPIIGEVTSPTPTREHASPYHSQLPGDPLRPISPARENPNKNRETRSPHRYIPTADSNHGYFSPSRMGPSSPTRETIQQDTNNRSQFFGSCSCCTGHEEASPVNSDGLRSHDGASYDGGPSMAQMRALLDDPVYQLLRRQIMEELSSRLAEAYLRTQMPTTGPLSGLSREGMDYLNDRQYYSHKPLSVHNWLAPSPNPPSRASSIHHRGEASVRSVRSSNNSLTSNIKSILSGHNAGIPPHLEDIKESTSTNTPKINTEGPSTTSKPDSDHPSLNIAGLNNPVLENTADAAHQVENKEDLANPIGVDTDADSSLPAKLKWYIRLPKYLGLVAQNTFTNNPYRLHWSVYFMMIACLFVAIFGKFAINFFAWKRYLLLEEEWDGNYQAEMVSLADTIITILPYIVQLVLFFFPPLLV
ncbi:hypothetical protein DM02DRAFT_618177 [Periconia macrospinosa]|uniref:Uncharacterized protein n=1 Tax=Periconia macrospinosa TaxID=97972 RepID=A0A2V1DAB8_9PLEO|nr:hypothetical protein DM02DRAFT_618177 [Periconia macrospinosa]